MNNRIIVVEDDAAIAELLVTTLERAGYVPLIVESAEEGIECLCDELPIVAVIDWMLPGESGLWLVEQLRADARTAALPIIMMSALDEGGARIAGVEGWVDDYIAKPFSPRDLLIRIRGLIDCARSESGPMLDVGPFHLDPTNHVVTVAGRRVPLRLIEFRLLRLLMSHADRELSPVELRELVWGENTTVDPMTLDIHMHRLRRTLGVEGRAMLARAVDGGYRLAADDPMNHRPASGIIPV